MGCDFYIVTRLVVEYNDGKDDCITLDEERCWFVEIEAYENGIMSDDDYDECMEKYGNIKLDEDIIIYENGKFINEEYEKDYKNSIVGFKTPWLISRGLKTMDDIKNIKRNQCLRNR